MITVKCPECNHSHSFNDQHFGKSAQCRKCQARLKIIPNQPVAQAAPAPQYVATQAVPQHVVIKQSSDTSSALAAIINLLFPPFGFLIQGRAGTFVLYLIAWFFSILLIFVGIGLITTPGLWLVGIIDAAQHKG